MRVGIRSATKEPTGGPSANSYYYSTDHLGSVRALHADDGSIVTDLDHDTYGNREVAVESVRVEWPASGRTAVRLDGARGLAEGEQQRAIACRGSITTGTATQLALGLDPRDPNAGRFLQEDPIWFNAGDPNVYRYVKSNPTKYTDPDGQTAAIQYACMADFGFGAGTIAGTTVAAGIVGVFADVAGTLGAEDAGEQAEYIKNAMTLLAAAAAQSGSQCRPRKPAPPGDCTWKKKAALQVAVEVNCKLGKPSENCGQAQRCAVARHIINRTCYKGGDKPHRDAERDAWRMVKHACGKTYGPPR